MLRGVYRVLLLLHQHGGHIIRLGHWAHFRTRRYTNQEASKNLHISGALHLHTWCQQTTKCHLPRIERIYPITIAADKVDLFEIKTIGRVSASPLSLESSGNGPAAEGAGSAYVGGAAAGVVSKAVSLATPSLDHQARWDCVYMPRLV